MAKFTVQRLIEELQEFVEAGLGDHTVMLAHQPNWPLRFHLQGVVDGNEIQDDDDGDDDRDEDYDPDVDDPKENIVYLVEHQGSPREMSPYAPKDLWAMC